ncbi:MAG: peptidase dimerization domain-containing protein [Gemmatimonadetes bacterium]|nr:peptidase dimerization domain-containing protein [Gemmatimonadota bacterium]
MKLHVALLSTLALLSGTSLPLGAQTTPTERAAAADILVQIEELQNRLAPGERARRIVSQGNRNRVRVMDGAAQEWDQGLRDLSDWIAANPEVGWQEYQAVDTLTTVLRSRGWDVTVGVAGLETAFVAAWDSPAGAGDVTLGLIGEYDALRDVDRPFHGDQHNAQTPVAMAAAFALQEHMAESGLPGRLRLYGTPAEEVGPPAKTIMHQASVFSEADILVRSHSSTATSRARAGFGVCCLNINEVKYTFLGRPSHQLTSWNGRNALEAAVMFYTAVDRLRSTFRPEASIQGVIPEGGVAPNVVPARAVVDYYIRYPDEVYLEHMNRMIDDAARGSAMATGTRVEIDRYGEYRDGITLGTLEELYYAYAEVLDAPERNPELQRPAGYEETGWVTRDIPGVGVSVYSSRGSYHTKGMWEDAVSEVGHAGFRMDARIMAAVLFDFLTHEDLREAVAEEHRVLKGLLGDYHERLREVYGPEISRTPQDGS